MLVDPLGLYPGEFIVDYWHDAIVTPDWHYNRNRHNQPVTHQEARDQGWTQMSPDKSIYHSMGPGNEDNQKFVSPDGKSEAVFHADGSVVTDPANMATYNYSSPNKFFVIGHVIADVIPYYIWGNSEDDPATLWERLTASYEGESGADKDPSH